MTDNAISTKENKPQTLVGLLTSSSFKEQIAMALPRHMDGQRMARIALTELRKSPKLGFCSIESFASSILTASQLGLEIGSAFGQTYLVPYGNECQLIVGYRGMIQLAHRSGMIKNLHADIVYAGDHFETELGMDMKFVHKPKLQTKDRAQITHVYAYAHLIAGGFEFAVLTRDDIEKTKKQSKSQNIWTNYFEEMAKKTALRRLFKYLPVSADIVRAISIDDARDTGNNALIFNDTIDSVEPPKKTDVILEELEQKNEEE